MGSVLWVPGSAPTCLYSMGGSVCGKYEPCLERREVGIEAGMSSVDTTCGGVRVGPCASGLRLRLSYACLRSRGQVGKAWSYILRTTSAPMLT